MVSINHRKKHQACPTARADQTLDASIEARFAHIVHGVGRLMHPLRFARASSAPEVGGGEAFPVRARLPCDRSRTARSSHFVIASARVAYSA
jgi:hypothetical protein